MTGRELYSQLSDQVMNLELRLQKIETVLGRIENRQLRDREEKGYASQSLAEWEFQVFSQSGQDGIIQYLIRNVKVPNTKFIEFGVQNYREANTRFLLMNNNWSGLIMDGDESNIEAIRKDPIYWRHDLKADCCFITAENINKILHDRGFVGDIGLLSIDIDGNDYWVWQALEIVKPAIVICEYNSRLGDTEALVVPHQPDFCISKAHPSWLYYGASIQALCLLASRKGYAFLGCNAFGNDAFFVRRDLMTSKLCEVSPEMGFVSGKFLQARDDSGKLVRLSPQEEKGILSSLNFVRVS
ncbi:MAG: hypothetical protein HC918_04905 [Oscillatoriales cyanobacterium SM2_1_8]|nr:hypothetical protein [Oscillatoriales cyanobacterium SM2_1_8]